METYVILSKLTDEGRKTIKENPKRIEEVNKELENMGARIVTQYALLGDYDFVTIIEAEDNESITEMVLETGARGTIDTLTMAAIPIDSLIDSLS